MTKIEFLEKLDKELKKRNAADAADIIAEYEQHFAFKLADGFSEEEICARLGNPTALAAQFEGNGTSAKGSGKRFITALGLGFTDLFAGGFFVLLGAWEAIMVALPVVFGTLAVCLLGGLNVYELIPPMPYWCGAVVGLSMAALTVLTGAGAVYFGAFLKQLGRSFARFQRNAWAAASGKAVLPGLPAAPQFTPKVKRAIRLTALISLVLFAVCFVLGVIASMLSAGDLQFWHVWGWFGYAA